MLEREIIKFEIQDVITASCACEPGLGEECSRNGHYGCPFASAENHWCELGES